MKRLLSLGAKKKGNEEPGEDTLTPKRESIVYLDTFRDSDTDSDKGAEASTTGAGARAKLFRALYDFQGDDDDLCFRAGDVVCVTEEGAPDAWWYGELNGREGAFPGSYVAPLRRTLKQFTAPEDTVLDAPSPVPSPGPASNAPVSVKSVLRSPGTRGRRANVRFFDSKDHADTYHREDYDRRGDFDPEAAQSEWELEEEEERLRMLHVRWTEFEKSLPAGQKCEERKVFEAQVAEKMAAQAAAEDRARNDRADKLRKLQEARAARGNAATTAGAAVAAPPPAAAPAPPPPAPVTATALTAEPESRSERLRKLAEAREARRAQGQAAADSRAPAPQAPAPSPAATPLPPPPSFPSAAASASSSPAPTPIPAFAPAPAPIAANPFSYSRAESVSDRSDISGLDDSPSYLQQAAEQRSTSSDLPALANATARAGEADIGPVEKAIAALEQRVASLTQRSGASDGFQAEFDMLHAEDQRVFNPALCRAAVKQSDKNRYGDILPYDKYRVVLGSENAPDNYINASHIKGLLPGSPEYIASQGPTDETTVDFWRMVTQFRTRLVIMVTRLSEGKRVKCAQYWPRAGTPMVMKHNDREFVVTMTSEKSAPDKPDKNGSSPTPSWFKREFNVAYVGDDGTPRTLKTTQLQFIDWPDHGVPESAMGFLSFLHVAMATQRVATEDAKSQHEKKAPPIVVHCSAGVGRSGVFCLVYSTLTFLPFLGRPQAADGIDILGSVRRMRQCRRYMVQTVEQYRFCYQAILHAARLYQDGSRQLRRKQSDGASVSAAAIVAAKVAVPSLPVSAAATPRASVSTSSAEGQDPVWLHDDDLSNVDVERMLTQPYVDGRFLVRRVANSRDRFQLSVCHDRTIHHLPIGRNDAGVFTLDRRQFSSLADVIEYLRTPHNGEFPLRLTEGVPRDTADRATRATQRSVAAPSPKAAPVAPPAPKKDELLSSFPSDAIVRATPAKTGPEIQLTGRQDSFTFVNGVYIPLAVPGDRPAFCLRDPISSDHGQLRGQSVQLYHDAAAGAWLLFLPGFGVVGALMSTARLPVAASGWQFLDSRYSSLVADSRVASSAYEPPPNSVPAEIADLQQRLSVAQARERAALQAATAARETATKAEQREAALLARLDTKQPSNGGTDSVAKGQLTQAEQTIRELQAELQVSRQREEELTAQTGRLHLSEEGLTRRLARAQATEDELRRELARAAAREEGLAQQLAQTRVALADSGATVVELNSKIGELECALVRMATAEDESLDLRTKVDALEHALAASQQNSAVSLLSGSHVSHTSADSRSKRGLPTGVIWDEDDDAEDEEDTDLYVAVRAYKAQATGELSFEEGDEILVTDADGEGWMTGVLRGRTGRFPSAYVGTKM